MILRQQAEQAFNLMDMVVILIAIVLLLVLCGLVTWAAHYVGELAMKLVRRFRRKGR